MAKKVLLLYISEHSGHHCASIAIENALHKEAPSIETVNINSLNYTNPILEKVINRAYMEVVKHKPELWDYLYDNPKVVRKTQKLREFIHKFNTEKLKPLIDETKPDLVVCTQAFPCGMIADYKRSFSLTMPLIGVLTDYAPHSYWIYNNIDRYIVPSAETGKALIANGIDSSRILDYGIPIDPRFSDIVDKKKVCMSLGLDENLPVALIMGGTQGLGPIREIVAAIERSPLNIQLLIATGTNKRISCWLGRYRSRKKIVPLGYSKNIHELMDISTVIITKPGGITTAEALVKGVPMLIISPLPGQESMNTRFLLKEGVAVKAETPADVVTLLEELLYNKNKLSSMSERARFLSRPGSAQNIARLIVDLMGR